MYKVEGAGAWPWRIRGQGGGRETLLNRHLYIYINNFSVHPTVGGKGREWRGLGRSEGVGNFEPCPGAAQTHLTVTPFPSNGAQGLTPQRAQFCPHSRFMEVAPPRPGWGHPQRLWACAWASRSLKESKSCSSRLVRMHCWTSSWPESSAPPSMARVCRD